MLLRAKLKHSEYPLLTMDLTAATICCALLDSTEDLFEVFCDHQKDAELKRRDGTSRGLLIKMRQTDLYA